MSDRHADNLALLADLRGLVDGQSHLTRWKSWVWRSQGGGLIGVLSAQWGSPDDKRAES